MISDQLHFEFDSKVSVYVHATQVHNTGAMTLSRFCQFPDQELLLFPELFTTTSKSHVVFHDVIFALI
jgi:hypothetical protein